MSDTKMLEAESTISQRVVRSKGKNYVQTFLYFPKALASDSQWPFKKGDKIKITIKGEKLEIEKA